jgi:hypothetical protein
MFRELPRGVGGGGLFSTMCDNQNEKEKEKQTGNKTGKGIKNELRENRNYMDEIYTVQ